MGGRQALGWLDWPPVWTAAGMALVWGLSPLLGWPVLGAPGRWLGAALVLAGLGLMAAAVFEMGRARTTVIPRRQPSALVTSGIFRFSRNPIYLGDVLVLAGTMLWFHLPWALVLIPVFATVLRHRFIKGEEARLQAGFGAEFGAWSGRVGRWIGPL